MSQTRDNIKRKRKQARRHSIVRVFRLMILAVLLCLFTWLCYYAGAYLIGVFNRCKADYDAYKLRRAQREATWDAAYNGYTNVLILGIDKGLDEGSPAANTLLFASLVHETGALRVVAIPRGTALAPDALLKESQPIAAVYQEKGAKALALAVQELLGVTVHQYIVLDIETAQQAIDLLGGLDVYIAEPMRYEDPEQELKISLDTGFRHLNGEQTVNYLRYRGGDLGDLGRVGRQQKFLGMLLKKLGEPLTIFKAPALCELLRRRLDTDGEIWDLPALLPALWRLHDREIEVMLLPGAMRYDGRANWQPDDIAIAERRHLLFPPDDEELE